MKNSESVGTLLRNVLSVSLLIGLSLVIFLLTQSRNFVSISAILIAATAWLALSWRLRNSISFSLGAILVPFAVTHWEELLRTQVAIGSVPIGLADGVILSSVLVQGLAYVVERKKRNSIFAVPECILLAGLSVIGLVLGFAFGNDTYYILKHWRAVVYLLTSFLLAYSQLRSRDQVEKATRVLLVLAVLAAMTLWRWTLFSGPAATFTITGVDLSSQSASVQAITESMDLATVLYISGFVLVLCRLLSDHSLRASKQVFYLVMLLFFIATIIFSMVRTNWIATGLITFYILVVSKRLRLLPALGLMVGLMIGVWGVLAILPRVTGVDSEWVLSDRLDLSRSGTGRIEDIRQAVVAVNDRGGWLFGNGLGATTRFLQVLPQYAVGPEEWTGVHSSFAWYYLNLGGAGLLCILLINGRLFRETFRGLRRTRDQQGSWIALSAHSIVLTLGILAVANNTYQGAPNSIVSVGVVWAIALRTGQVWSRTTTEVVMSKAEYARERTLSMAGTVGV